MALKKDKEKVLDEVWTEDRVKSFLDLLPPEGENADFHMLHKAYQSMRDNDFEKFVGFFIAAGKDLNAQNQKGRTVLSIVEEHRHGKPFAEILRTAGAK